jgi:hypothetical protein
MRSLSKNKAQPKKEPLNQKRNRTVSPQRAAVSSAVNSGGPVKTSKVIQSKLFTGGLGSKK